MSQRDLFGGQLSNYCLPPAIGSAGQVLTAQAPPSSGPNFLTWSTPSAGGQVARITGGTLSLAAIGGSPSGGPITGTFNLYTSGSVVTMIVQSVSGSVTFADVNGTLVTSTAPFAPYVPNTTIWGSMAGSGGTVDGVTSVMGNSVGADGNLTIYPMYASGTHTIGLAPFTLIWDSSGATTSSTGGSASGSTMA